MNRPYDLIIFDCDGTLADSELAHNTAASKLVTAMGVAGYTPEKCREMFAGKSYRVFGEYFGEKYGLDLLNDQFLTNYEVTFSDILPDYIRFDNTTEPMIRTFIDHDLRIAVGSNGTRNTVHRTLEAAALLKYFPDEIRFTVETVSRPKPAPDLYLHVCEAMQVTPDRAIVIEDTLTGASAGLAAGITTVGYIGLTHVPDQGKKMADLGCHHVINRMGDLDNILRI